MQCKLKAISRNKFLNGLERYKQIINCSTWAKQFHSLLLTSSRIRLDNNSIRLSDYDADDVDGFRGWALYDQSIIHPFSLHALPVLTAHRAIGIGLHRNYCHHHNWFCINLIGISSSYPVYAAAVPHHKPTRSPWNGTAAAAPSHWALDSRNRIDLFTRITNQLRCLGFIEPSHRSSVI